MVDNAFATRDRHGNEAWPAPYRVDEFGRIRTIQIGQGGNDALETAIRGLLAEG